MITCDDTLELTGITAAGGIAELPVARENAAKLDPTTRSGVVDGRIAICAEIDAVSFGTLESVAVRVKLDVPTLEGVPSISPLVRVRPFGNDPVLTNA